MKVILKVRIKPDVVVHTYNLSIGSLRQKCHGFKASLSYIEMCVASRTLPPKDEDKKRLNQLIL